MTKYKVGLTGLLGSGKSLAAGYFANCGIDIIDTDMISHQITGVNGEANAQITKVFGQKYINASGDLNRDLMRELVFNDQSEKQKLENILHPLIFNHVVSKVETSNSIYTIIMVPLLFQSIRYASYMDCSIFVDCSEDKIIARVIERNGWDKETILKVLNNQMTRAEQIKIADDILDNNDTPMKLELQVKYLHEKYKARVSHLSNKE